MKYQIIGEPLPVVVCDVNDGETLITEKGAMSWMSPNMVMETKGTGGFGKMMGRMFSGESMFQNKYTAKGGPGQIAFASSFPGSIRAVEIKPGQEIVVQKSGFLAAETGVQLSVFFQKKVAGGLARIIHSLSSLSSQDFEFFPRQRLAWGHSLCH